METIQIINETILLLKKTLDSYKPIDLIFYQFYGRSPCKSSVYLILLLM